MAFILKDDAPEVRGATWPADIRRLRARILAGPERPLLDVGEPDEPVTLRSVLVLAALGLTVVLLIVLAGGAA